MKNISGLILDIEGVLLKGGHPLPGAASAVGFLREHSIPFRCLSNSTQKSRGMIGERLRNEGINIPDDLIITPAVAVGDLLKENRLIDADLLVTPEVKKDILRCGIIPDEKSPDAVVVGDAGHGFTFDAMNRAFRHLCEGSRFYALEKDRYWRDADGLTLSAGPFVRALEYASGEEAVLVGKPSLEFFQRAVRSLGLPPSEVMMVGDDIVSDIGGAQNAGINAVLVKTGKFSDETLRSSCIAPDLVMDSVADIPSLFP